MAYHHSLLISIFIASLVHVILLMIFILSVIFFRKDDKLFLTFNRQKVGPFLLASFITWVSLIMALLRDRTFFLPAALAYIFLLSAMLIVYKGTGKMR